MRIGHVFAIIGIYLVTAAGWGLLGSVTSFRTYGIGGDRLEDAVADVWGGPIVQQAPRLVSRHDSDAGQADLSPSAQHIETVLVLEHRRKGLQWYPTYRCQFAATYRFTNDGHEPIMGVINAPLPDGDGTYRDFVATTDADTDADAGSAPAVTVTNGTVRAPVTVAPGETVTFTLAYTTNGLRTWTYAPTCGTGRAGDIEVVVRTNVSNIDFPEGSLAATEHGPLNNVGDPDDPLALVYEARWQSGDLLTNRTFRIELPNRLNPGPLVTRIIFFAPVCLGFFYLVLGAITVVRGIPIHPMHYAFVAGGFFAFHLLLAYLVDVVWIHVAFPVCAAVSLFLVNTYLRGALGKTFPTWTSVAAMLFYLVLFSYSFFFEGSSGLAGAVTGVLTLAVLMYLTAGVDWHAFFARPKPPKPNKGATTDPLLDLGTAPSSA